MTQKVFTFSRYLAYDDLPSNSNGFWYSLEGVTRAIEKDAKEQFGEFEWDEESSCDHYIVTTSEVPDGDPEENHYFIHTHTLNEGDVN